jgi:hypothetical protein
MSAFNPSFKHRLNASSAGSDTFSVSDLTDTLFLMCERAAAMVSVVAIQFEGGEAQQCSNAVNAVALDAVYHEIKDIEAVLMAFLNAEQDKGAL